MLKSIGFLSLLLAGVRGHSLVVEKRELPPPGFSRIGPSPPEQTLNLRLGIASNNIAGLQDAVYDISTPGNDRYGRHLTQEEVNQFVAPSKETLVKVTSWLEENNLASSPISPAGDWVSINLTVSKANELFAADFSTFQNQGTNQTVVRTLSYSIPSALTTSINWVHPTVNFPSVETPSLNVASKAVSARSLSVSVSAGCRVNSSWTPACLQELYGIPSTPAKVAANVLGVSGFSNQFANKRDLKAFLETYRPDMNPNTTFDFISVDDGINNQLPGGAGFFTAGDIQNTIALTTGLPVTFISTGTIANDLITEMLDQANSLLTMANPPQTIVNGNSLFESQVSPPMASSLCNVYAQLAARGVSYIVQTGGAGAGGFPLDPCTPFDPPFPASCPFVTAVGATEFNSDQAEETASRFSGGGFSNLFKRPDYQDTVVQGYLQSTGNTESAPFNSTNRAVPDVSAINHLEFVQNSIFVRNVVTTAYSADIFASIVALLTNERIAAGKPGLGFLNPLIYQNPSAFTDMTVGSNPGCHGVAFNATAGWDPITGFGSPIYAKLQEISDKL